MEDAQALWPSRGKASPARRAGPPRSTAAHACPFVDARGGSMFPCPQPKPLGVLRKELKNLHALQSCWVRTYSSSLFPPLQEKLDHLEISSKADWYLYVGYKYLLQYQRLHLISLNATAVGVKVFLFVPWKKRHDKPLTPMSDSD